MIQDNSNLHASSSVCRRRVLGNREPLHKSQKPHTIVLNKFLMQNFIRGIDIKYHDLFIENINPQAASNYSEIDIEKSSNFLEIIIRRVRVTKQQFKKVCCIVMKFLESCRDYKHNFMLYLKYNFHKLLVAALVLSVTNAHTDFLELISVREATYDLYSRATGLSVDEVINCSSIVRGIVLRKSRLQNKSLQLWRQMQRHTTESEQELSYPYTNDGVTQDFEETIENNEFPANSAHTQAIPSVIDNIIKSFGDDNLDQYGFEQEKSSVHDLLGKHESEYVLLSEITDFNKVAKQIVQEHFTVV